MCLAALALNADSRFPVVIAANRDEYFARSSEPMAWWQARGMALLAGRDLAGGGTWLGLNRAGRLALLTNVREPSRHLPDAPSRGSLVIDWLARVLDAARFGATLAPGYNGFNLITADLRRGAWHWLSNRTAAPLALPNGIHALSNALPGTPWPKTEALRAAVATALGRAGSVAQLTDDLLVALADASIAPDAELPDTGVGLERERLLSARFVRIPDPSRTGVAIYGTRCTTLLIREASGATHLLERTVTAEGAWLAPVHHRLPDWP